jgi:hypothetical protein
MNIFFLPKNPFEMRDGFQKVKHFLLHSLNLESEAGLGGQGMALAYSQILQKKKKKKKKKFFFFLHVHTRGMMMIRTSDICFIKSGPS